jgi:hypothetical protein
MASRPWMADERAQSKRVARGSLTEATVLNSSWTVAGIGIMAVSPPGISSARSIASRIALAASGAHRKWATTRNSDFVPAPSGTIVFAANSICSTPP